MKFCTCIAEYNPLHTGHMKHLAYIKQNLGAENVIVIMSGNFTQRGEPAVMDKFSRARQAIIAGADVVIELPTVFAVSSAEVFAKGAVKIINDLGIADGICFGVESGTKQEYVDLATALNNESKEFKRAIKEQLDSGVSLAKAKYEAVKALCDESLNEALMNSPNNILGLEYTKALLKLDSKIDIYPMLRTGDHREVTLKKDDTSATSIRNALKTGKIKKAKKCIPNFVYKDLTEYPFAFDKMLMSALITTPTEQLKKVADCTEGLENRIKALSKDNHAVEALIEKVTTKRYPETRMRRILTANLLGIEQRLIEDCLEDKLYAKILAVNGEKKNIISALSTNSVIPVLTRKSDTASLKKTAEKCFEKDVLATELYNLATDRKDNEHAMLIV